jgi:hypothetical protein
LTNERFLRAFSAVFEGGKYDFALLRPGEFVERLLKDFEVNPFDNLKAYLPYRIFWKGWKWSWLGTLKGVLNWSRRRRKMRYS